MLAKFFKAHNKPLDVQNGKTNNRENHNNSAKLLKKNLNKTDECPVYRATT